ncbi:MAG TPA: DUF4260 domain-containing protein [Candidatus Paceibacterota bacterium]|nr:DUF4260 domain-containing protein [Candidatus Paceibacterota bacterium]
MTLMLKLEYLALFILSIFLFATLSFAWWWYAALILVPDVGMLGYLVNAKVGAITYNITHWIVIGAFLYIAGSMLGIEILQLAGLIIVGHASFDRFFGYGLKLPTSFKETHLGRL